MWVDVLVVGLVSGRGGEGEGERHMMETMDVHLKMR